MVLNLVGPSGWTEIPAVFTYTATDPYVCSIVFPPESGEPLVWVVGRDLVRAGMVGPAGDSDVRLWPCRLPGPSMFLHFRTPDGEALFELDRLAVAVFLQRTDMLVTPGTEADHLDFDTELGDLP